MDGLKVCDYCEKRSDLIELHTDEGESRFICLEHFNIEQKAHGKTEADFRKIVLDFSKAHGFKIEVGKITKTQ